MISEFVTDRHLGGYIKGGDPATSYPEMWKWLVSVREVRTVLDVGCGDGATVNYLRSLGCRSFGIDGIPQKSDWIIEHDYTKECLPIYPADSPDVFDLVWSCEFVEHVEEKYVPSFLVSFALAPIVLMTHAVPGQSGWHHVNCQPREYWIDVLGREGYALDPELTRDTKALAATNTDPHNHYVRSGLAFRRIE